MIDDLFRDVSIAFAKQLSLREDHFRKGDYFNVFNVLKLSTNETRTHSAFIAELLNPKGSHGMGDYFLNKFISHIGIEDLHIDTTNTYVQVERPIGHIDENYDKGGRIDIILENGDKGIIIENKIYAQDQYHQLVRYYRYAKSRYTNYRLLYLSLDKEEATVYSTQSDDLKLLANKDYYPISYRKHIIKWLSDCIEGMVSQTIITDIINQYINLLKQLTNNMEENNLVLDALKKEDYFPLILEIYKNQELWKNAVWKSFCAEFREALLVEGYVFEDNVVFDFYVRKHNESPNSIHLTHESSGAYIGLNTKIQNVEIRCLPIFQDANATWPYGWKWLDGDYWKIRPYYQIEYMSAFFPENRKKLIEYLLKEIKLIYSEAKTAGIEI